MLVSGMLVTRVICIWEDYGRDIFAECSSMIATQAIVHINKETPDSLFFQRSPDTHETCALAAMVWTMYY